MKNILIAAVVAATAALSPNTLAADKAAATSVTTQQKSDPVAAANALLDDLDAGRIEAVHSRFSPRMAYAVTTDQLKTVWVTMPQQFGKFEHRGTARVESPSGMTVVTIPLVYEQLTLDAIVATDANGAVAGFLVRPAAPPPAAVRPDLPAHEVAFGPADRTQLPGTLLLPKGNGPFPAVVLVHGSGPNDRDESVGGTRVFRDIAEGLADRGIASLRYEKRTKEHPAEFERPFTIDDETTNDAVAAVAFLKTQHDINPKRIYIVGHSQGAMMAPRIAQHAPGLAGLVMMAAPARHLEYLVLDQLTYLSEHDPAQGAAIAAKLPALRAQAAELNNINPRLGGSFPLFDKLPASYWRDLATYNQVEVAKSLHLPMLFQQGERDFQVTGTDWEGWKKTFADDRKVVLYRYPGLNHLFVSGTGLSLPSEYAKPGHVDPDVISDLASWIKAN